MNWIKFVRNKNNLTQKELSEKTGIPLPTLKRIENESDVNEKYLEKIADALHCNICNVSEKACIEDARRTAKEVYKSLSSQSNFNKNNLLYKKQSILNSLSKKDSNKVVEEILEIVGLMTQTPNEFLFTVITDIPNELKHTKSVIYTFINALN